MFSQLLPRERNFNHPTRRAAPGLQVRRDGVPCEVLASIGGSGTRLEPLKLGDPQTGLKVCELPDGIPVGE